MLVIKYFCFAIAIFCTVLLINTIISDVLFPPALKAIELNVNEDEIIKKSSVMKLWLILIMSLTWPIVFLI